MDPINTLRTTTKKRYRLRDNHMSNEEIAKFGRHKGTNYVVSDDCPCLIVLSDSIVAIRTESNELAILCTKYSDFEEGLASIANEMP